MPIKTLADIYDAMAEGRTHTQAFAKSENSVLLNTNDQSWFDWSYTNGVPAYDARVGVANTFTPRIGTNNRSIWFPPISAGQERYLACVTLTTAPGGGGFGANDHCLYDLLAVYPLIDGDSSDVQTMVNAASLPRYSDGVGVQACLINHVAAQLAGGAGSVNVTTDRGTSADIPFYLTNWGLTRIALTSSAAAPAGGNGMLALPLPSGAKGIVRINSLRFTSTPGGYWAIYLFRPLLFVGNHGEGGSVYATKPATEKCLLSANGGHLERIYDGADLGWFLRQRAGSLQYRPFGNLTFVWG